MSRLFGERIREFVLSADIMDQETFFDLLQLIATYVRMHLDVVYFSVLDETTIDDQMGLRTLWSTREESLSYTVDKEGGYTSHTAYTFGENRSIWVVSASRQPLQTADDLRDMWENADDLPAYSKQREEEVRTSVMHPLRVEGRAFGVVEFAAAKYVEPTSASLEEVETLASVISRAYRMYDVRKTQRDSTKSAMRMLEEALSTQDWKRLALPQLFVAHAGTERLEEDMRAEHEVVIETIRGVVGEFANRLNAVYWEDITEAGDINHQVIRDIGTSDFGLCYFSEPTGKGTYQDNANVLFEAGMMQALANSRSALLRAWIPVREKESGSIPFDIAAERMLFPDRADGVLDKESFAKELKGRVTALLERLADEE